MSELSRHVAQQVQKQKKKQRLQAEIEKQNQDFFISSMRSSQRSSQVVSLAHFGTKQTSNGRFHQVESQQQSLRPRFCI